jgi:hypothetical protein
MAFISKNNMAMELFLDRSRGIFTLAKSDASPRQIIRGHFHRDSITQ